MKFAEAVSKIRYSKNDNTLLLNKIKMQCKNAKKVVNKKGK